MADSVGICIDLMKLTLKQSGIRFHFLADATRCMIKVTHFTINGTTEDYQTLLYVWLQQTSLQFLFFRLVLLLLLLLLRLLK